MAKCYNKTYVNLKSSIDELVTCLTCSPDLSYIEGYAQSLLPAANLSSCAAVFQGLENLRLEMSSNVRSPVKVQVPVNIPDGVGGEKTILKVGMGLRRLFVQTDAGNVLDIELHRGDKVQSLKKTVQALLHMPTEQSALLLGDHILEDDLSEVRNESHLLLTRELYRSSSVPCLSPSSNLQRRRSTAQPFEVVGGSKCCSTIKDILRQAIQGLKDGMQPILASGGLGGAYYFRNLHGENIAIVKPTDEEPLAPNNPKGFVGKALGQPGLNRSIRVGETGIREVAAYLLDHDHFGKVPATALVKATHPIFNVNPEEFIGIPPPKDNAVTKIASFQQYVAHDFDANDCGTSCFPVSAVHRIGILDVRIFNTDRHAGNILVRREKGKMENDKYRSSHLSLTFDGAFELIPIDHGLCLPETLEDPYFEWLHWPQASFPFSEDELNYIRSLDPYRDADMLRKKLPMLREACLRMLILCTVFLQKAVAAGLCLAEIGAMMSREGGDTGIVVSELEMVCMISKTQVEQELSVAFLDEDEVNPGSTIGESSYADQFLFDMDHEEPNWGAGYSPKSSKVDANSPEIKAISCQLPSSPRAVASFGFAESQCHGSPSSPASSRSCGAVRPPRKLQELQAVKEEVGLVNASRFLRNSPPCDSSISLSTSFFPCFSTKFNSHTHQFQNHFKSYESRDANKRFVFQVTQKPNIPEGLSMAPFVISDMGEKAWMLFMNHFESLVQEAFVRRKCDSAGHLQRLGKSCQF